MVQLCSAGKGIASASASAAAAASAGGAAGGAPPPPPRLVPVVQLWMPRQLPLPLLLLLLPTPLIPVVQLCDACEVEVVPQCTC
jgi:hypothetical protein